MVAIEGTIPPSESALIRTRTTGGEAAWAGLADQVVKLASLLQSRALALTRDDERRRLETLASLARDPSGLAFVTSLTDQAFRPIDAARVADQIRFLIERHGAPHSFSPSERGQLKAFEKVSSVLPRLTVPAVLRRIRHDADAFIVRTEGGSLDRRLGERASSGVRINLNLLGEAILGEQEARSRIERLGEILSRPDVDCVSVKVSSIASQVDLLGWERSLELLCDRLEALHEQAILHPRTLPGGALEPKLVYLDMESFRDLRITVDAFMQTLSRPRLERCLGGVALQAYLPDSHAIQRELTEWAMRRVARGGAPIRIRLVKGANLSTEAVEASLSGLTLPIYGSKAEVDASFRRMLDWGARPERVQAVHLGLASHNVFDISLGLSLRESRNLGSGLGFELLEGMNEGLLRALHERTSDILVYAPTVNSEEAESAIAYLMRRLDENTGGENILGRGAELKPGSVAWSEEEASFRASLESAPGLSERSLRQQDRGMENPVVPEDAPFTNEADTDWALPRHRAWLRNTLKKERERIGRSLPAVVGGESIFDTPSGRRNVEDPSRPGVRLGRQVRADWPTLDRAIRLARLAAPGWASLDGERRSHILAEVARQLRRARAELIGAMVAEVGKAPSEADAEVSEAIDFAEYYRRSLDPFSSALETGELTLGARGVILVTPPWNFPLAIPAGGVLAALMGGNAVLLKPAAEASMVAHRLAEILWASGVPEDVLHFIPCDELEVGDRLIGDRRIDAVVLTGSRATAREFQWIRPERCLMAETGGKNATLVTAMADRDLAIHEIVRSAFGYAGQKCSATSLVICEGEVYDDPRFRDRLADAASSLHVGSAWDPGSVVTPLIHPPEGPLLDALGSLEEGESWLLAPQRFAENPRLVSPGIKLGVRPGSPSHREELFGPLLCLMRARNLDDAIAIANATAYGLTAALFSLDPREQERFIEEIDAGNLYVNRGTTGAIVRRQPFGGWKASSYGPGAKAGGPNYVLQMMRAGERGLHSSPGIPSDEVAGMLALLLLRIRDPLDRTRLQSSARSYAHWQSRHFEEAHDPSRLRGEDNFFRYRPLRSILLVADPDAPRLASSRCVLAAMTAGVNLSVDADLAERLGLDEVKAVPREQLEGAIRAGAFERIRMVGALRNSVLDAAIDAGVHLDSEPPIGYGRVELLRYHREQSVTIDYHRHGNLGERARELG